MWREIINNGGILTLIGVVVGFLLSEVTGVYKKHTERKDAKNSLHDEIRFNYEQTKNKIDILNQVVSALKNKTFLSTKCGKYSTTEFENLYHIAIPKLSIIERDNLRHLNSFYLAIDNLLDSFDETFKSNLEGAEARENTFESVYKESVIQLEDIRDSLQESLALSSDYLNGKPVSIFNSLKG
ncbi:hypothetical protein [Psychromonas sp. SA13A]|uniref:hypothetical protein n=1 Tax=Psychromonas sp. SA13A TaxID=2686346 RepID=UPI00140AE2AE|nr:hypothetical protein [Psychromonas sp. SA13A]